MSTDRRLGDATDRGRIHPQAALSTRRKETIAGSEFHSPYGNYKVLNKGTSDGCYPSGSECQVSNYFPTERVSVADAGSLYSSQISVRSLIGQAAFHRETAVLILRR
jgi:hypothetical protein